MSGTPLICLPFAGAGASVFSDWSRYSNGITRIMALQLPGREKRFAESPYRTVKEAVEGLFPEALNLVGEHDKVVLFGHSMGAILAYELARKLVHDTSIEVEHLFVSGSPSPWTKRREVATGLSDDEFIARIVDFTGYQHAALEVPEMRDLLLPTLRADVEMHESYCPVSGQPLPIAITSMRGVGDLLVSSEEAEGWRGASTGDFNMIEIPGGHMYLVDNVATTVSTVENTILLIRPRSDETSRM